MALDISSLENTMVAAGQGLGTSVWNDVKSYAEPELKKIATQMIAIEKAMLSNPPEYSPQAAHLLLDMQIRASVGVIVAMTTLTQLAVQTAINQILGAVKQMVNGAVNFALIP